MYGVRLDSLIIVNMGFKVYLLFLYCYFVLD